MRITLDLTGIEDNDLLSLVRLATIMQRRPEVWTPGVRSVTWQLASAIRDLTGERITIERQLGAAIDRLLDTSGIEFPPDTEV